MASPRAIRGALRAFLGTYTSRYSAFDGYWLFGFVVTRGPGLAVDLMADAADDGNADEPPPLATARALARARFREQLAKNGVAGSVASASLLIEVGPAGASGRPHWRDVRPVRFTVEARSRAGATVAEGVVVQVAPHDPRVERRSGH